MISVIIPVYKVEPYLKQCVSSILIQSERDIDVILIDDGSTDNCGIICDEFAALDPRVRTYHTNNRGLSGARNYGLEKAKEKQSKYVYFIDGDDWLEQGFLKKMYLAAEKSNADVAVCGWSREYRNGVDIVLLDNQEYDAEQAMQALLDGTFRFVVWNKLWKMSLFDEIEFPDDFYFEDALTTYRIIERVNKVVSISETVYHYRQRRSSIVYTCSVKRLLDQWQAAEHIWNYFINGPYNRNEQILYKRLDYCSYVAIIVWTSIRARPHAERKRAMPELKRIAAFVRGHFPRGGLKGWRFTRKAVMFLTRRATSLNFALAALMSKAYKKKQRGRQLFD